VPVLFGSNRFPLIPTFVPSSVSALEANHPEPLLYSV
jgi:hypothetical protein